MNRKIIPFFLILSIFLYACQNTTQSDESSTQSETTDQAAMQEESDLTSEAILSPDGYSTSTNVSPPIEQVTVPTHHFTFKGTEAKTINIKETGTSIVIPANVFVDADGNPIQGKVDIEFKEYHDVGDIIASGIPMRMTAPDGSTGYMQSAGMYEIQGESNGKPIFIKEGESIEINLASDYDDAVYDFWSFKRESKQWLNKGVTDAQPNPSKEKAMKRLAKAPKINQPLKPYKFDKNKPVLEFDINFSNLPELKEMHGILWQYAGDDDSKNPVKNKWVMQENWDAAEIEPFPSGNLYKLTLKNDKKSFVTTVCPSQSGEEFERSMLEYARKQKEYEANKLSISDLKQLAEDQKDFIRTAQLDGFGIYNYDLMVKDEDNILVDAKFDFGTMIPGINNLTTVYMIVDNRNVVCYPASDWAKIRISPTAKTRMMAILPGKKYATISESEFAGLIDDIKKADGLKYTFKMSYEDRVIASLQEMKDIIQRLA